MGRERALATLLRGIALCALTLPVLAAAEAGDRTLTLDRLVCHQGCPSYRVTIHEAGLVEIEARQNVEWVGSMKERLSAEAVAPLFGEAEALGFPALEKSYAISDRNCDRRDEIAPLAILGLNRGEQSKTVRFHTGCRGKEPVESLGRLAERVDAIAGTPGRLLRRSSPAAPEEPAAATQKDPPAKNAVHEPAAVESAENAVQRPPAKGPPAPAAARPSEGPVATERAAPARSAELSDSPEDLLARFREAYSSCRSELLEEVVDLDAATRGFFEEQCRLCEGFDVSVDLEDALVGETEGTIHFRQRVRCEVSQTVSQFDLLAHARRGPDGNWHIERFEEAP